MKRFLLLYSGPPPVNPTHEGWPEWFDEIGDALVDPGSPMRNGFVLRAMDRRATPRTARLATASSKPRIDPA